MAFQKGCHISYNIDVIILKFGTFGTIVVTKFLEITMSLLDFSPRIPLGTFSILPLNMVTRPW